MGSLKLGRDKTSDSPLEIFKETLDDNDDAKVDSWILIALYYLSINSIDPARKTFEKIYQNVDKNDQFVLVNLGNIFLELSKTSEVSVLIIFASLPYLGRMTIFQRPFH